MSPTNRAEGLKINCLNCLFLGTTFLHADEEAGEATKSRLYRPASKCVPTSEDATPASSAEYKKSVSLDPYESPHLHLLKNVCEPFGMT